MNTPETLHHGAAPHECGFCCTRVEKVGVRLGGSTILRDITLHLHCGELTVVVGPNGAGKSMLLRALLGEVKHTGSIQILPVPRSRHSAPVIGYVPQHLDFDRHAPLSVLDLFVTATGRFPAFLGATKATRATAIESLEKVKASHLLNRRLGALSGGEFQRVLLALALTPVPNLLLLDEPVSGVDAKGRDLFYQTVSDLRRQFDLAILMVSHDLAPAAAVADRMVFLRHSIITTGRPAEVLAHPELRSAFALDGINIAPQS